MKMKISFFILFLSFSTVSANACTIFTIRTNNTTYFGNNEDYIYNNTFISFKPSKGSTYGFSTLGYHNNNGFEGDNLPQGGYNTEGLAFDANALPPMPLNSHTNDRLKLPSGNVLDNILMFCKNVPEVINWFLTYDFNMSELAGQIHFADASGNATVVSVNNGDLVFTFINEKGYLVSTNFNVANTSIGEYPCERFNTASTMLDNFTNNVTEDQLISVLDATHAEGDAQTVYSYLVNLKTLDISIYYVHDFTTSINYNLVTELQKGNHTYDLGDLFKAKTTNTNGFEEITIFLAMSLLIWKKKVTKNK